MILKGEERMVFIMREIKFKAFDTEKKAMTIFRKLLDWFDAYAQFEYNTRSNQSNMIQKWIFLEHTGLSDKNGNDIYEGDIIKHFNKIQMPEDYTISKIIYDKNKASFRKLNLNGEMWDLGNNCTYEIIGNIYENPELFR